jgi:hypothetical protein
VKAPTSLSGCDKVAVQLLGLSLGAIAMVAHTAVSEEAAQLGINAVSVEGVFCSCARMRKRAIQPR